MTDAGATDDRLADELDIVDDEAPASAFPADEVREPSTLSDEVPEADRLEQAALVLADEDEARPHDS